MRFNASPNVERNFVVNRVGILPLATDARVNEFVTWETMSARNAFPAFKRWWLVVVGLMRARNAFRCVTIGLFIIDGGYFTLWPLPCFEVGNVGPQW